MNKIFKVIYSKTRHCYVVVSELAKSHCKSTTGNTSREHRTGRQLTAMVLTALMGFTFGIAIPSTSWALDGEENKELGTHATVSGGKNNTANGTDSTIAGGSMNNTGTYGTLVAGGNRNVAASLLGDKGIRENIYKNCSTVVGGNENTSLGAYSTLVGGYQGVVQGDWSTGIAGGSTGDYARYALAAGYGAVVTNSGVQRTANTVHTPSGPRTDYDYSKISTALGYQATANQPGTISFGHDVGDVSGYEVKWTKEYDKDLFGNYKHTNADGSHIDYTKAPTITEKYYTDAYYNRLVKIADGINGRDAVTMRQMAVANGDKADTTADNVGANYKVVKTDESGNTIYDATTGLPSLTDATSEQKTANESAWGQALGTGEIVNANDQLVTGGTVYNAMLNKANVAMDNITNDGKTVIRNLAKEAVKVVDGEHTYVTSKPDGNATAYAVNIKTGQVVSGDGDLVTGGTVYDAIQNAKMSGGSGQPVDISGKADVSAGNVGLNFTKYSDAASTDEQKQKEKIANENAWGKALGTGKIANSDATVTDADTNGSKQLVTGNTVYKEVRPTSDGTYIKIAYTTAQNLTNLDTAIQNQATDLKVNQGWGIAIANETDPATKVTKKNVISLSRNLGKDYDTTDGVNLKNDTAGTSLILGGRVEKGNSTGGQTVTGDYGALGKDSVTVGGVDNTVETTGDAAVVVGGIYNKAAGKTSAVVGGSANDAIGNESSVFGGFNNDATGLYATISGGSYNRTYGEAASVFGGSMNNAVGSTSSVFGGSINTANGIWSSVIGGSHNTTLGLSSTAIGGENAIVDGTNSVGIAGGSTKSDNALAAGNEATVTVNNGTAIGYQATANKEGTVAFGHDKGDVYYTSTWPQKATEKDGKYYDANNKEITKDQYEALRNADLTFNDYSQKPTVTENKYGSAAYNRLVKVADGVDDHDVVVMEQLKDYSKTDASNIGNNIKVYKTDENGNVQLGDDKKPIEDKDATTTAQKANKDAWGTALGADTFTTGTSDKATNASDSDQLVTGKTLYNYDKPTGAQNYVKANNTTGQNLSALDVQVKANADTLKDKTHNIKYYSVNDTTLPKVDNYSNESNDGAKGMGSIAAGFNTHADGIASTVAGSYSGVINQGTTGSYDLRGATALSYGTFNFNQNTDTTKTYSGVANSIIGQANATTDSNAAIIYGAGNTVTNSYRDIDTSKFDLSKVEQDIKNKDAAAVAKDLQAAVSASGGQVMVMGGGNTVDKAYMTQVTGVGNTVSGKDSTYAEGTSTQYNFIDGFQNELSNGKHDYIIGSNNKVSGDNVDTNKSNIILGDNHKLTNQKNNVIIGSSDTADNETAASDIVAIGHNAKVSAEGGVAIGSGSEASVAGKTTEGYDPTTGKNSTDTTATWQATNAAVSIGKNGTVTRQINGLAAGTNDTDAVNVAQLKKLEGMKATVDASNIGKNLKGEDGKTASTKEITANENAWGTAIGTGKIEKDNGQLVTGKTVYAYNKPVAEAGKTLNYVSADKTTGQNLTTLDEHVKTNADAIGTNTKNITTNTTNITKNAGDITKLTNLSNITNEGQKVIKKLSKDAVKVTAGDRVTVTPTEDKEAGTITYKVSANNNGKVAAGDQNLVSGDTVNTAITNAINNAGTATDTKLAGKANIDATNIGKNLKGADGKTASTKEITANENAWGTAIGTGKIEKDNGQLVTGKTVYAYNKPVAEAGKTLNYVLADKTTGQNLTTLDEHVKMNADAIGTNTTNITKNAGDITNLKNLSNITDEGQKVIKKLSKDAVKVTAGDRVTVTPTEDKEAGTITYKVSANNNGKVAAGDQNLVSGDTVNTAITNAINNAGTATDTKLAGKANIDATNIGKNLKGADGKTASTKEITANENAWGTAIGTGEIAKDNGQLVTGKTVYDALHGGLDDVVFGHDGKDGKPGKDGSIGLVGQTGKKGEDGKNAYATTIIKTEKGVDGVDGKNGEDGITRIIYNDTDNTANKHTVATLDDGMKYAGDTGDVANVKLDHQLKLSGTTFDEKDKDKQYKPDDWTSDNIAVISSAADETTGGATMYLKLNKDLNLTDKGSVRFGDKDSNTTLDASGLTIKSTVTKEGKTEVVSGPSMTKDGIDGGSKAITNIGSGIEKDDKGNYTDKSKSSAANIGDVQTIVNDAKKELTDGTNGLNSKANVDASNIGENLKDAEGNKASADAIKKNKEDWASAIGTNEVKEGNKQLVTSDAVAKELAKKADKSYVDQELGKKADKTYVDEKLDTKANKSDVYTKNETYSKSEVDSKVTDITKGLDGKAGKDLDNISDKGKTAIHNIAKDAVEVVGGVNTTVKKTKGTDKTPTTYAVNVEGKGKVASGDTGLISGDTLYKEVHVDQDGSYIRSGNTVVQNLSALDSGLKTTSDLIHTNTKGDTIQIGGNSTATKIDVSGKDKDGNTTGRVITGIVTDGKDLTSAANVGYVNGITSANTQQIYRDMNNAYSRLDTNINRAAAGSNALAALHPLDFDPADKASFAVGYGHYHNANAAAIGAFYQPNANTMVNMGISLGNGDPGFNAGVSFKLGKGSAYNGVSKAEMAQTIHDQAEEISAIKANDAAKDKRIDALEKENQEMKKQIQEILSRLNG